MLFPVIVHKDSDSDYGITIPDFPGVFSGGPTLEEALHNVHEALEMWFCDDEVCRLPAPSPLERVFASEDAQTGAVVMVEVDPSAFGNSINGTAPIIVPLELRDRIDAAALKKGQSIAEYVLEAVNAFEKSHEAGTGSDRNLEC